MPTLRNYYRARAKGRGTMKRKAETKKKRETKQQDLHFLFRRTVNAKPRNSLCVTRVVKKKKETDPCVCRCRNET